MTLITTVQTNIRSLYEDVVWPIGVINSTRMWSRNLVGQYRGWMSLVYYLPIQSAQTVSPQKLENTILSGRVGQLSQLAPAYDSTYGLLSTDQQAPLDLRQMMDMNDSLAQDALQQQRCDQSHSSGIRNGHAVEDTGRNLRIPDCSTICESTPFRREWDYPEE